MQPGESTFDKQLALLMKEVREQVAEEEGQLFPQLRSVFTVEELLELGAKVERVKSMAPTRPYPSAPDRPPGDKLLGPIAGLFDRMRDALSHRGTH